MKLRCGITVKLSGIMLLIASMALAIALFGIAMIDRLARASESALDQHLPLSRCSEQALLAVSQGSVCLNRVRMIQDPGDAQEIPAIEGRFRRSMLNFDMFIKAMIWGSQSEAFRQSSPEEQLLIVMGHRYVVSHSAHRREFFSVTLASMLMESHESQPSFARPDSVT